MELQMKNAVALTTSSEVGKVVDYAIETNRMVCHLTGELDVCKTHLRREGVEKAEFLKTSSAEISGLLGKAQIILTRPQVRIRKGVDLLAAEAAFPPGVFDLLFVKKTVVELAPDFEDKLRCLPLIQQRAIRNLIQFAASTPRVNLPK
jgi:hypothetical protein